MNLEESKQFLRNQNIDPEEVYEDGKRYGKVLNEYADAVSQNQPAVVSAGFFPDNQLHLKAGSRILNIRARHILKHREVIINCIEHWEADDPDFGSPERNDAAYFVNEQEIDKIIEALKDAKRFLNGCQINAKR